MKKLNILVLLLTSGFLLAGCDDSKKTIKNISEQPELQGTFSSECKAVGIEGMASISSKDELKFRGNQLEVITNYYSDVNCRKEAAIGSLVYNGEFEVERKPVGDATPEEQVVKDQENQNSEGEQNAENANPQEGEQQVVNKDDLDAGTIKLKIEEAEIKPVDQTLVSLLNGISFCGQSDYEKNKSTKLQKEISGTVFCPIKRYPSDLVGSYIYNEQTKDLTLSDQPTDMPNEGSPAAEGTEKQENVDVPSLSIIQVFAPTYSKE